MSIKLNQLVAVLALFFLLLIGAVSVAQPACPAVSINPNNVNICSGCTTLTATVQGTVASTSYSVNSILYAPFSYSGGTSVLVNMDDDWSDSITLPFCFQFFGNTYNKALIGANGELTFDLTQTSCGTDPYRITSALPFAGGCTSFTDVPGNTICAVFRDVDPSLGGSIDYYITGTAPCRALVVNWVDIPLYDKGVGICDSTPNSTFQLVLYENTNYIDVYIQNSYACDTLNVGASQQWNGGYGIVGIQNQSATVAVCPPNRNYPITWTANNEAWRFTPTGAPQYNLTWYAPPNTPISTALSVSVCPSTTTTYTATVVNNTCNGTITVTDVATVTVGTGGGVTMTMTPSNCSGNTGTATATPNGGVTPFTYNWIPTGQNTQTATGLFAGTYSVTVTDASGCSGTQTVVVTSIGGLTATASSSPTSCSINSGTATANPTGGNAPYTYLWNPSAQNSQTATGLGSGGYTVTITDANGCVCTAAANVIAPNGITAVNTTAIQTSCYGGTNGSATATPVGGISPYNYLWNNGQTAQTATGLSAGSYSVSVMDSSGCLFKTTVIVTQPASAIFSSISSADTCGKKAGSATSAISGGASPYTYLWLTNPVQSSSTAVGLAAGTYTCIITDNNGCTVIGKISVANIPGPIANFTPNPQTVDILDASIFFIDLSSNATTWLWNFGDGIPPSTQQNPFHTYQSEGTFLVTLMVTNGHGCADTISKSVIIEGYSTFYVPNTFTPNGDGRNDFFAPVFTRIDNNGFSMLIFDRWGNEIFNTTTLGDYWNGKVKNSGKVVPEDVYVYVITYRDIKKQDHKLTGNVNVVK